MAEQAEATADAGAAQEQEKAKKSTKLPLLLGVLVLVAAGGGAAWYFGIPHLGKKTEPAAGAEEAAATHTVAVERPGPLVALDPFIANLADESGSRYLKATFQLEFLGKTVPAGMEARSPQIRDLLLTLLTSKSFDEIRTPEGKQELREQIIRRVNQALDRDSVKAVYFTEFIVQ
jgi:flagellar FliL protein